MYFSLIAPAEGDERAAAHQRIDAPYADHQWLWRWFPAAASTPREFLFRRHEVQGLPRFYVVSSRPPAAQHGAWQASTREYAPRLESGDPLSFELRANPTVRHARDRTSKRHDVVMEAKTKLLASRGLAHWKDWSDADRPALQPLIHDACGDWLARRGESLGFEVGRGALQVESYMQHREEQQRNLVFTSVDFSGRMTVTDPSRFAIALARGIGHAKAFGCGLLLVRRLG